MLPIYVFCTIVGGGLLLLGMLGDFFEGDAALDDFTEVSDGVNVEAGVWKEALSFRTLAYGMAVFGASGWVLSAMGTTPPLTALLATGSALAVSAMVAGVMGYLRSTESGFTRGEDQFVGAPGRVVIPFAAQSGNGEVSVRHAGRVLALRARPHAATPAEAQGWRYVVVVAMRDGVAEVAPVTQEEAEQMGLPQDRPPPPRLEAGEGGG